MSHAQAAARGRSGKEVTQVSSAGVEEDESPRRRKAKELGAKTCILLTGPLSVV